MSLLKISVGWPIVCRCLCLLAVWVRLSRGFPAKSGGLGDLPETQGAFRDPSSLSKKIKFTSNSVHICVCGNVRVFLRVCVSTCVLSLVGVCLSNMQSVSFQAPTCLQIDAENSLEEKGLNSHTSSHMPGSDCMSLN